QIRISGLIAPPQHARSGTQWQYVFLNGRHIRDRFVSHAIRESYRGLLEANRQPVVFVLLEMAPEAVDVNVHPAKTEVRFADSNAVHAEVLAAIRDRLLRTDLSVRVRDHTLEQAADTSGADTERRPDDQTDTTRRVRQAMADFFQNAPPASPAKSIYHRSGLPAPSKPTNQTMPRPMAETKQACRFDPDEAQANIPPETIEPPLPVPLARQLDSDIAPFGQDIPAKSLSAGPFLQVHNAYLVAQTENGLIIVDQHALHERIIYEQLHRQAAQGPLESQRCLIPETLDVTDAQMAALENATGILQELGILVEPFGPRTIAIQGFPSLLAKVPPADFVADLLDVLIDQAGRVSKEQLLHELLDMMACKAAVKAGDPLSEQEIASLLAQRSRVERGGSCPHGRPTAIQLTLQQLEKQFKRT
ncbi:MAG: hypothetical protein JW810_13215, partial [Sedimentisphaerales bacterium]|nr:hypothetical protein [Sedimentisphaerales bacterium]